MTRTIPGVLAAAFALIATGVLAMPTEAQKQAVRSSCASDYKTYCSAVPPGGRPSIQCLERNMANLVPACQQAVKAVTGG